MLKPLRGLGVASRMRHLRVPSTETQAWLTRCKSNGWLASASVRAVEEGFRAVPLLPSAPLETDAVWNGLVHIELEAVISKPTHWTEHLPIQLQALPSETWPSSYELQGDVLMVKVEPAAQPYAAEMAKAMLAQLPNVRLVCADDGVKGEFRVRDLHPILSRNGDMSTLTNVREHGAKMLVDPSKAYFSSRLSTQRHRTLTSLKSLRAERGHGLIIADPYAGVGPAFPTLFAEAGLVRGWMAGDLNPEAVALLSRNLEAWTRSLPEPPVLRRVVCLDARCWKDDSTMIGQADAILVNLPHDSFDHIPFLLPLFVRQHPVLLRGWAIRDRGGEGEDEAHLRRLCETAGMTLDEVRVEAVKGFSATKTFVSFEVKGVFFEAFSS